jgi:peptidoglycan/LPS O-acetylase OafA/YrhL
MVLLAHAPELTDGNRSREIMARLTTPQFTFGILGVDGFFLLSGYLIIKSWINCPDPWDFLRKRFLRIAPGYAVATLVAIVVVGLIAPGESDFFRLYALRWETIRTLLFAYRPAALPVFPGNHYYRILNGSLWTILYEFRCYLIVAVAGMAGLFKRPKLLIGATAMLSAFFTVFSLNKALIDHLPWPSLLYRFLGDPSNLLRFMTMFFVGGCFFVFKDRIKFTPDLAYFSVCAIIAIRFAKPEHIEGAFVMFGGYLLFYFGSKPIASLSCMARIPDLSYGIYLYGWPVESLFIWYFHPSPWIVFAASTFLCAGLAWLSWTFVEGPALSLKNARRARFEQRMQLTGAAA